MNSSLTKEQQELVEKNHQLIYGFANQNGIDPEETYDVLAIGLCKAALNYDPARGSSFSTLAYRCMKNELLLTYREKGYKRNIPKNKVVSLNEPVTNDQCADSIELLDFVSSSTKENDDPEMMAIIVDFRSKLSDRERYVFDCLYNQITLKDIAEHLGCSKQNVYSIRNKIQRRWMAYNGKPVY